MLFWQCDTHSKGEINMSKSKQYDLSLWHYHNDNTIIKYRHDTILLQILFQRMISLSFNSAYLPSIVTSSKTNRTIQKAFVAFWYIVSGFQNLNRLLGVVYSNDLTFPMDLANAVPKTNRPL